MLRKRYNNEHMIFWSCCAGLFLFGMALAMPGVVVLDVRLLYGLDAVAAGALFFWMPLGILAGSVVFGPVCDRYGYRLVLTLAALGLFAGFRGMAAAQAIWQLEAWVFCIGVAGGVMNGATNAVVSDLSVRGKGASLSLLGVSFGAGALAMPQVMLWWKQEVQWQGIMEAMGGLALVLALVFVMIRFPSAVQPAGQTLFKGRRLLTDMTLLLMGGFLFFQSGFESIVHNWATLFLTEGQGLEERMALFGLTLYVAGLTVMRLLSGSVFRNFPPRQLLAVSLLMLPAGILLLKAGGGFLPAMLGMVMLGGGLAGGFPIMLGFAGERYPGLSGTAFSIVLTIALMGKLTVDVLMGWVVREMGVQYLTMVALGGWVVMLVLGGVIVKRLP